MTVTARTLAPASPFDAPGSIAGFVAKASFEATRLAPGDIETLTGAVAPATPVYLAAVAGRPHADQIATARALTRAGFEAVPHIAARGFPDGAALDRHLAGLAREAHVKRVLVIGGDHAAAAGTFRSALEIIESGLLQAHGIQEVGIAGYPEGHPQLTAADLERALAAKIEAAAQTGLGLHIVTQFGFSAPALVSWIVRLRDQGIDHPVRVGLAGPAPLAGLLRYARICGVTASALGLARHAGLARHLFGMIAPDALLRPLVAQAAQLGDVAPHVYSFGGVAAAVRWAAAVAAGRITIDRSGDGFGVDPP